MKRLAQLQLNPAEKKALREMKQKLMESLPQTKIVLYGSKARGDSGSESDMDLLVLTNDTVTSSLKERIGRMKYEIELRHDVVISVLVENTLYWRSALACAMPLHKNIDRDGITL